MTGNALLEVCRLTKTYVHRRGTPPAAVDTVSFTLDRGETLALVGESGSGKTTTARLLLRLDAADSGRVAFDGKDWLELPGEVLRRERRHMQMVFQDPNTSLNPRMTVGDQIAEPLRAQAIVARRAIPARVAEGLVQVGLDAATALRFPRELSGGQRQRIAIARALATEPKLLICDEPTSSLDVSIAGQIVNLLLDLRDRSGLAMLFISHDLVLVRSIADRIAVMYRGRVVEQGRADEVTSNPLHPYTAALLSAVLEADPAHARERIVLRPAPSPPPAAQGGCRFVARCPIAQPRCSAESPSLSAAAPQHGAACFFPGEWGQRMGSG